MTSNSMRLANTNSGGLFHIFTDRKINTKIGVGFACVLAITAGLSATATLQFNQVEHNFNDYSQKVANSTNLSDIDRQFVAFRRYVGEVSDNMEENIASAQRTRGILREQIERSLKNIKNPERHMRMTQLSDQFDTYAKDFDKVVVLRREQAKLVKDVLDPTGAKLRGEIEQLQNWAVSKAGNSNTMLLAGEALKHLMLARLNANKVLARHDAVAAQGAEKAFTDLKSAMAGFGAGIVNEEVRKVFTEVNANVEQYAETYRKAAHDSHEIEKLFNGEMRNLARTLTADAEAIKAALAADEKAIETETDSLISSVERLVMLLAIGGLALGGLLAWAIGRGISRPIQGMTRAMTSLAGGDLKVVVPAQDNKDEIGEMAKAVLVFRDAAIDKVRMEREAEEERVRSEEARRKAEEEAIGRERAMVSTSIGAGMAKLAAKDLTFRLTDDLPEAYKKLQSDFNEAMEQLEKALQSVKDSTQAMDSGTAGDLHRVQRPLPAHRAAGLEPGRDRGRARRDHGHRQEGRRGRHARPQGRGRHQGRRREERRGGAQGRGGHGRHREVVAADQPDHRRDRRDRLPDQPAGAQRRRRGGACRRCRPRLRGGGLGGAGPGPALGGGRQGDQGPDLDLDRARSSRACSWWRRPASRWSGSWPRWPRSTAWSPRSRRAPRSRPPGLQQVNTAVNQMDKVTQQNAAMAEQATAASRSLSQESAELSKLVEPVPGRRHRRGGARASPGRQGRADVARDESVGARSSPKRRRLGGS